MKLRKLKEKERYKSNCSQCNNKAKYKSKKGFYCGKCAEKYWRENPSYRNNRRTCAKRIKNLRKKATWAEKIFRQKLKKAINVKFKFQRAFVKGGYYAIVDFHIPSRNICIEIDGEYHQSPEQKRKDRYRDNWLKTIRKQKIIRITN